METVIASSVISFNGGESKLVSIAYPVASNTCKGMSTVYVSAYAGVHEVMGLSLLRTSLRSST